MNRIVTSPPHRMVCATFVLTGLLSALVIGIARAHDSIMLVWLANGPVAALLCLLPVRRWPSLLAAQLAGIGVGAAVAGSPVANAGAFALMPFNLMEAALAAWLLRRTGDAEEMLQTPSRIGRFFLLAVLVAPALTAVIVGSVLWSCIGGPIDELALRWPVSHGLGMMVGFPLALMIFRGELLKSVIDGGRRRLAIMFGLVLGTTFVCFSQQSFPMLYLPTLPLVVASLVAGRLGATVGLAAVVLGGGLARLAFGTPLFIEALPSLGQQFYAAAYLATLFGCALPVAAVIEQRTALRRRLARSEAHFRALAEAPSDAFLTLTADGRIRYGSNALRHLGGWEPTSLSDQPASLLVHPSHRARVAAIHQAALASPGEVFSVEYQALQHDGSGSFWLESTMRAFHDPSDPQTAILCVSRDLSARKRREDELRRAADTDALTALPNRAAFRRIAGAATGRGDIGTVALLDLDHFKNVNDRHGHAAGDLALRAVADLLREAVRGEDVVARYGGEEFAILFRNLTLADASRAADRLAAGLAMMPIDVGPVRLRLTASIGLAELAANLPLDHALQRADESLYAAKRAGRNQVMAAA